jgi:hypothetical protein
MALSEVPDPNIQSATLNVLQRLEASDQSFDYLTLLRITNCLNNSDSRARKESSHFLLMSRGQFPEIACSLVL